MSKYFLQYPQFCDSNGLTRIDATAEDHLANLDKMAIALLEYRQAFLDQIASRCPKCNGTGKCVQ